MESVNNPNPYLLTRRGGVPSTKTNKSADFQVKKMATEWRSRNVNLASRNELLSARDALVRCGVVLDGTYSAAATLLNRINTALYNFKDE